MTQAIDSDGVKARALKEFPGDFSKAEYQGQTDGDHFYKTKIGRGEMPKYEGKLSDDENINEDTSNLVERINSLTKELVVKLNGDDVNNIPYIHETTEANEFGIVGITSKYNPKYGDDRNCICGYPYLKHFDGYKCRFRIKYIGQACNNFVAGLGSP